MSSHSKQIIGIMLVKNDEFFVEYALRNVVDFCDKVIVLDNMSKDSTFEKVSKVASQYRNVDVQKITNFRKSHEPLEKYANTETWVLGVDGDEVYNRPGLIRMRERILRGEYDQYWCLKGHMLHVNSFDFNSQRATGYGTPPARSVTKLFNFGALLSWKESNKQRLHGPNAVFKPGYSKNSILKMYEASSWSECDLRCIHTCFVRRSRFDPEVPVLRKNPSGTKPIWRRNWSFYTDSILAALKLKEIQEYKNRMYNHGSPLERDISDFDIRSDPYAS